MLYFRHLESELSRIKHQDPLRTCEISEDDIFFTESGKSCYNLYILYHEFLPISDFFCFYVLFVNFFFLISQT